MAGGRAPRSGAHSDRQGAGVTRLDATRRMLRACRGEPVDRPPVWLMRQAGRYLPEYRALREGIGFLDMCRDVERAVEASLQPIRLVGSEAVVFFCDIFVPVLGLGVGLDFAPGPVVASPIRTRAQVEAWVLRDPRETVPYVFEILRRLRRALASERIPLIGFAGAPFTLATYLVEGQGDPTRRYPHLMRLLREEPALLEALLAKLGELTLGYLRAQIDAGAQVVQLFDTWAGVLDAETYARFVLPGTQAIAAGLRGTGAPLILYLNDAPHLFDLTLESGADVLSIGAAVPMAEAARRAGRRVSLQGNLDPRELTRGRAHIFARVKEIAEAASPARGLVLNLGHGCLPDTPVEGVRAFTDAARALAPA